MDEKVNSEETKSVVEVPEEEASSTEEARYKSSNNLLIMQPSQKGVEVYQSVNADQPRATGSEKEGDKEKITIAVVELSCTSQTTDDTTRKSSVQICIAALATTNDEETGGTSMMPHANTSTPVFQSTERPNHRSQRDVRETGTLDRSFPSRVTFSSTQDVAASESADTTGGPGQQDERSLNQVRLRELTGGDSSGLQTARRGELSADMQPPSYTSVEIPHSGPRPRTPPFVTPVPPPSYSEVMGLRYLARAPTPPLILNVGPSVWGHRSQAAYCDRCHAVVVSSIRRSPSAITHISAVLLFVFLCWPCCVLPYCIDYCQTTRHYCPGCSQLLGRYYPLF